MLTIINELNALRGELSSSAGIRSLILTSRRLNIDTFNLTRHGDLDEEHAVIGSRLGGTLSLLRSYYQLLFPPDVRDIQFYEPLDEMFLRAATYSALAVSGLMLFEISRKRSLT